MKNLMIIVLLSISTLCFSQEKKPLVAKATTSHSVSLSCGVSTSTGVTGYNFYRGTSAGGEALTPLNSSPVPACAYSDTNVTALTQYFYTAKAFCPTCAPSTSGPSNEVNVTVPGDPQPLPPTMNTPTAQ